MPNTHPVQSGDLRLIPSIDGARVDFSGGQPLMDQGLETAVYISLFGVDYWGNALEEPGIQLQSRIPEIVARSTVSNRARLEIEQAATDSLAWMLTEGVAAGVQASAIITGVSTVELTVTIEQPSAPREVLRYQINWQRQREITASGRVTREVYP